jgi:phosphoribosylamine--glycine ligase
MKVLIVGGGGREHALAWKASQSANVTHVFVAPGNAGTGAEPGVSNVDIRAEDVDALLAFAHDQGVDLTVVGPEAPLVAGITDAFTQARLRCFGPTRAAAQLEGSKSFAKDFMARHHIPTATYRSFDQVADAERYIRDRGAPLVIKADGLAAGKGVVIARSEDEALGAVRQCLESGRFGAAGSTVVVEEFLTGEEASFICMVGGGNILPLASSQDHKARDDGDRGPNTGGMGAYSPAPVVTEALHADIMARVIEPTVRGMADDGIPYTGFLYAGLMVAEDGSIKVLEYNCRFGDPETQPILMRMNSDLIELCERALSGRLEGIGVDWDARVALGVVMAAGGYPGDYRRGDEISGLDARAPNVKVFHAGTRGLNGRVVTNGGRVLCVTALGASVRDARDTAYGAVSGIRWPGAFYRTDIGHRALQRQTTGG